MAIYSTSITVCSTAPILNIFSAVFNLNQYHNDRHFSWNCYLIFPKQQLIRLAAVINRYVFRIRKIPYISVISIKLFSFFSRLPFFWFELLKLDLWLDTMAIGYVEFNIHLLLVTFHFRSLSDVLLWSVSDEKL